MAWSRSWDLEIGCRAAADETQVCTITPTAFQRASLRRGS